MENLIDDDESDNDLMMEQNLIMKKIMKNPMNNLLQAKKVF